MGIFPIFMAGGLWGNMNRSSGGILAMAVLVAMLASGSGTRGPQGTAPSVAKASAALMASNDKEKASSRTQPTEKRDGFEDETQNIRDVILDATSVNSLSKEDRKLAQSLPANISIEKTAFMVALVPDPVKTHLSLTFDRYLDALEQGIQDREFDFDRALLPWDEHEHPESDNFSARLDESEYVHGKEQLPGILIFRKHHSATETHGNNTIETLLVFIVGESPTAGINREQFVTAL